MLWIAFAAMLLAGALFVCWPLYRVQRRLTPGLALAALGVVALSGALYMQIGSPGAPSGPAAAAAVPTVEEMVASLEERLQQDPTDVAGWKMLGRSHVQLGNYDRAIAAFEEALEREPGEDAQTLANLGEAVVLKQEGRVNERSGALFEAALAAAPNNQKALFYGGIAAIQRNEPELAAERWEALLALAPPPEVQDVLRARIAEWRGQPSPAATPAPAAAGGASAGSVTVNVTLSEAARAALDDSVTVFVIVRDPAQPSPPIAATRRKVAELPTEVALSDSDAMIPGRLLSQFDTLEIVVRASLSGQPMAAAGDWYGSAQVDMTSANGVAIEIGSRVQ